MIKLLVIADDFTGALDTGVQFAKRGIKTQVLTGTHLEGRMVSPGTQVLVIDAETRPMSAANAYQTVRAIAGAGLGLGAEVIYKKTDSALRGNVGSELAAVVDAAGGGRLYFIPAFPEVKRTTVGGIHYIDGVPLEKSGFGKDPFDPMTCSGVPEILRGNLAKREKGSGERCAAEGRKEVLRAAADGPDIVCVSLDQEIPSARSAREIVVFDAASDGDIRRRAAALKEAGELRILAGCAGFAAALPGLLGLGGKTQADIRRTEGLYVACGSVNPITRDQVERAEAEGFFRTTLSPRQKLEDGYLDTEDGRAYVEWLKETCAAKKRVIVDSFDREEGETDAYAKAKGIDSGELRRRITGCHGRLVKELIASGETDLTVLMTGGDTLMGLMREIGADSLEIVAEVGQGTVLSRLSWAGGSLQVISKSGGLGEPNVLVSIARQVLDEGGR